MKIPKKLKKEAREVVDKHITTGNVFEVLSNQLLSCNSDTLNRDEIKCVDVVFTALRKLHLSEKSGNKKIRGVSEDAIKDADRIINQHTRQHDLYGTLAHALRFCEPKEKEIMVHINFVVAALLYLKEKEYNY